MKKLRWVTEGNGIWDVDMSTPLTLEGEARPVPGDPLPLPLGISRGIKLSRPKQLHFFQRFMSSPFIPSYSVSPSSSSNSSGHGFCLQSVLAIPSFSHKWFGALVGQFNFQKFLSSLTETETESGTDSISSSQSQSQSLVHRIRRKLGDKSLYALGFSSELSFTPHDTLLVAYDTYGYGYGDSDFHSKSPRKKAILHHEFSNHNLIIEAVSPGLFVDVNSGNYWDVPFSTAIHFASLPSCESSYHLSLRHNAGSPKLFRGEGAADGDGQTLSVPSSLLPGFSLKTAFAFKKNIDIWRSKASMLKLVQPFDLFLSNPRISASAIIGGAMTAYLGDNSVRSQQQQQAADDSQCFTGLSLSAPALKSAIKADMFSSVSFTAQHGNFQRLFLDLTRFHARLDFPSGSKFLSSAAKLAQDFFNSQQPSIETLQAISPNATVSLQQQIAGPFSFRVDSGVAMDCRSKDWRVHVCDPVFAVEYALQVLGSAKAIAWYSPKQKEFMVELRFSET